MLPKNASLQPGRVYWFHMRIKAWAATGTGAVLAGSALGIVIDANDPYTTGAGIQALFWLSLFLAAWGVFSTILTACRMNLAASIWIGGIWAAVAAGTLALARAGRTAPALLGAILLATLVASVLLWRRFRHG